MRCMQCEASSSNVTCSDEPRSASGGGRRWTRRRVAPVAIWLLWCGPIAQEAAAQNGSWQVLTDMPTPRRLLAAAEHGGKVYTFGGCGSPCFDPTLHPSTFEETLVEVYDPASNTWTTRGPMPTIFFSGAAATLGNFIYLAGGALTGNVLQRYNPANDTWALMAPMPTSRRDSALVAVGGKLFALGGIGPTGAFERYNPGSNSWSVLAGMPTPRGFLAAAAVGDEIYAIGGSPDCCGDSQTNVVEAYDTGTGSWRTVSPMPVAQQLSAAASLAGKVYVFGGFTPDSGARDNVFEYDPGTDSWSPKTPMPTARDQAPAVRVGNAAYVVGGSVDCHCQALDANERYVLPGAGLEVTKDDGVSAVAPGSAVSYEITVTNNGPGAANGAKVRDSFPSALAGVTWECEGLDGASCGASSGTGDIDETVDLPVDATVRYVATGTVTCDAMDVLVNTAEAEVPGGVFAATDIDEIIRPSLLVSKTSDKGSVNAGGPLTYTITVENDGICDVGATVTDIFPPELIDVAWTCTAMGAAGCTADGDGDISDPISLPVGGKVTYTVTADVACDATGPIVNTVTVEPGGESATVTVLVLPPLADLAITKTDGALTAYLCEDVTYTIEVKNNGPCPVTGAVIFDDFLPELGVVAWMCSNCTPAGTGTLSCTTGFLPPDGSVSASCTATGVVDPGASGSLSNTALVSAPVGVEDPDPANNTSTDDDAILKRTADLTVSKECTPNPVLAGTELKCKITITNTGPDDALDALVTDPFPPRLLGDVTWTCMPEGGASCTLSGAGDIEDQVGLPFDPSVPAGSSVTYVATGKVKKWAKGEYCNTATVEPPGPPECFDDPPENNSATDCVTVLPDCNENGVADAIDIANGTSEDVDTNGEPDECQIGNVDWIFSGIAEGGTVVVTIEGIPGLFADCLVVTATVAGESPETVATNNLTDLDADPCLAPQALTGMVMGTTVWVEGFLLSQGRVSITITDPGLSYHIPPVKIPTLSAFSLGLIALLLSAAGAGLIARRRGSGEKGVPDGSAGTDQRL